MSDTYSYERETTHISKISPGQIESYLNKHTLQVHWAQTDSRSVFNKGEAGLCYVQYVGISIAAVPLSKKKKKKTIRPKFENSNIHFYVVLKAALKKKKPSQAF